MIIDIDFSPEEITRIADYGTSNERALLLLEDEAKGGTLLKGELRDKLMDLIITNEELHIHNTLYSIYSFLGEMLDKLNDNYNAQVICTEELLDLYVQLEEQLRIKALYDSLEQTFAYDIILLKKLQSIVSRFVPVDPERLDKLLKRIEERSIQLKYLMLNSNAIVRFCMDSSKTTGCRVPSQLTALNNIYSHMRTDPVKQLMGQHSGKWLSENYNFIPRIDKIGYNKHYYLNLKQGFKKSLNR